MENSADRVYQKILLCVQKKNAVVYASTTFELWVEYMYLYSTSNVSKFPIWKFPVKRIGNHADIGVGCGHNRGEIRSQ